MAPFFVSACEFKRMSQVMEALRTAIVGVAGYTGAELVRILATHPRLRVVRAFGHSTAGQSLRSALPSVIGVSGLETQKIESLDQVDIEQLAKDVQVAFTALPHAESARVGARLFRAGIQVVDLSADYRLKDTATYERWYGPHPEQAMQAHACYGLVEWHREELKGSRLIASPGCYATCGILGLGPLLEAGLIEPEGLIVDATSGVSGAGRQPKASTHYPETAEGLRPYNVAGAHRHTPEIEQELSLIAKTEVRVLFTPQLAPINRGILACAYARIRPGVSAEQCRDAARQRYQGGLVTVLEEGELPDTLWVRGTARALVAYALDARTGWVIAFSALDNLSKGASGQAVQALNVARDWPEDTGLPLVAAFP